MTDFKCTPIPENENADLGDVFFEIGCHLLDKSGSSTSNSSAALWFALGTMAGSNSSQMSLGMMLGEGRGVPKDLDLSLSLLQPLAVAGEKNAKEAVYFLTTPDDQYVCECCRTLQLN